MNHQHPGNLQYYLSPCWCPFTRLVGPLDTNSSQIFLGISGVLTPIFLYANEPAALTGWTSVFCTGNKSDGGQRPWMSLLHIQTALLWPPPPSPQLPWCPAGLAHVGHIIDSLRTWTDVSGLEPCQFARILFYVRRHAWLHTIKGALTQNRGRWCVLDPGRPVIWTHIKCFDLAFNVNKEAEELGKDHIWSDKG